MASKYTNFNLLKVEDVGESDDDVAAKPARLQDHESGGSKAKSAKKNKKRDKKPEVKTPAVEEKEEKKVDASLQPQVVHEQTVVEAKKREPEQQQEQQKVSSPALPQPPQQSQQPPQSTDHSGAKKSKKQAIVTRTIWTFIMVFGFFGCLVAGHAWLIMLVMLCQSLSYREVTALFGFKTEYGIKGDNSERDRWSTILNW